MDKFDRFPFRVKTTIVREGEWIFTFVKIFIAVVFLIMIGGCGLMMWGGCHIAKRVNDDGVKGIVEQVWNGTNGTNNLTNSK